MTGAGWIVPKKYVEKVGADGFKKAPIGAGPYKFVSFNPGVELVLEAFDQYWRKPPSVKTLVFRVIPDEATRLAALKRGEVDIAYSIRGELAEDLRNTAGLSLKPALVQGVFCLYFPDQWDPKSPWHDERVRRAASLAEPDHHGQPGRSHVLPPGPQARADHGGPAAGDFRGGPGRGRRALRLFEGSRGATNVVYQPGYGRQPLGDLVAADVAHEDASRDVMSYADPDTGERNAIGLRLPRTREDWYDKRRAVDAG